MRFELIIVALGALVSCRGGGAEQPASPASNQASPLGDKPTLQSLPSSSGALRSQTSVEVALPCSEDQSEFPTRLPASSPPTFIEGTTMSGAEGRPLCHDDDESLDDKQTDITFELGRSKLGPFEVRSVGPEGSGRYWTFDVVVDFGGTSAGFCLHTSTVGWRQVFGNRELADQLVARILRVQDVDGDGVDEFVVPSSFELGQSLSETAITATAFDRTSDGMQLDRKSTHLLRSAIGKSYRSAADSATTPARHKAHYRAAAEFLDEHNCSSR